ncbi:hypothetical protein RM863_30675 [Streptomyces sp. DSM 41014]|uniref:Protein kilB n=1 Tax=Streptomyces hintoniae TaxID=3075521 RepID=A0ABU2UT92_9ACTN|nr:hypothetical protein [Streptomyces sp. DSM 41014]MDT0476501.1 hypothetical protein [Streptomyces sp. DSM 41014]
MEVIATSLIAVLGTLLGSSLTYLFQRRTAERAERFTRAERLRQERIDAYCSYGGALANFRRGQLDHWFATHDGNAVDEEAAWELRREAQRLRALALEAQFRVELLTLSDELSDLARQALRAVDRFPDAHSREDLEPVWEAARSLMHAFIAASRRHVPDVSAVR